MSAKDLEGRRKSFQVSASYQGEPSGLVGGLLPGRSFQRKVVKVRIWSVWMVSFGLTRMAMAYWPGKVPNPKQSLA